MQINKFPLAVAAGFAIAVLGAGPGHAADATIDQAPQVVVRYADLNLATDAGAARLYRRIVSAAQRVCPDAESRDLEAVAVTQKCRADAVSRAVHQVNDVRLSAVYGAMNPHG